MGRRNARLVSYELTYESHQTTEVNGVNFQQIIIVHKETVTTISQSVFSSLLNQYPFGPDQEKEMIQQASKKHSVFNNFDLSNIKVSCTGLRDKKLGVSTLQYA
jgi:glycogen synthase